MRQIKVLAVLFALLPGIAAAQPATLPASTVYGRQATPSSGGPGQAIPFSVFFANAGVPAGPVSCSSHNWFNTLAANGVLGCAQPAIGDISGLGTGVAAALAIAPNSAGGFVTSPVPYANIAAGTSDTALGYWGSTVVSATSIPNCTGALVYSTSTHLFTCNTSGGTGTVTSVTCFGAAITTSGTCTTAAAKSDQQTATSTSLVVTPSQQQNHPSALKAVGYATLSGTTLTDHSPYNASISRTGVGTYTISFTPVNFANTNYSCTITPTASSSATVLVAEMVGSKSTTSMNFAVFQATAFGAADPIAIDVHCAGSQ